MLLSASRILSRVIGLGIAMFALWISLTPYIFGSIIADDLTMFLAVAASVVLHELLHATAALLLGTRSISAGLWKRGPLLLGFYVSIGDELPIAKWLVVALTPLLFSPVYLLLAWTFCYMRSFLIWLSLTNTVGSAGDVALAILAAGSGWNTKVKDAGEAIEVRGGEPSRFSWALLNASATFGYALLFSFITSLLLMMAASFGGGSIELLGVKLVEAMREGGRVTARTTPSYSLSSLLAGLVAAAAVAIRSLKGRQSTYTTLPQNNV